MGKKKQPNYRIIALDKKKDPWGNSLEILGSYNPRTKEVTLNKERIEYWLSVGAQPSNTIHNLFVSEGIVKTDKKAVTNISKKRQEKLTEKAKEKAEKEEKPAETPAEEPAKKEVKEEKPAEEAKSEEAKPEENK